MECIFCKIVQLIAVLTAITTLTLAGCGGGSKSGNGTTDVSSSPAVVLSDLKVTNLDSQGFPWDGFTFAGMDKRWNLPIPVKINGESRAGPAMDAIEAKLGMTIFDRTSIASTPDSSVTRGLIFSKGTAYVGAPPLQNWCANISNGPNQPGYPPNFLVWPGIGEISSVLYVNYDSPYCTASSDVAIHELGHALGLGAHFNGFGNGPPISTDFWSVLATLYGNPVGTPTASMVMVMK